MREEDMDFNPHYDFAKGGRTNDKVSKKIRLLKKEGYPHDQAVAIALSMRDSGKLARGGKYKPNPAITKKYARSLNKFDYSLNKVYDMAEKLSERPQPRLAKGGKTNNDFKEQTLDFKYKGKRHKFTFTPEESDEWVTFKSKGIDFDVHYDEEDNNIVVYEYIKELKTQPYDTIQIQDIKYAKGGKTKDYKSIIEADYDKIRKKSYNKAKRTGDTQVVIEKIDNPNEYIILNSKDYNNKPELHNDWEIVDIQRYNPQFFKKRNYAKGGFIQEAVKEMKEKGTTGSFTKQAKNAGMTNTAFAKEVLKNPKKFTEKTRKRAMFMKNTNPDKFNFGGEIVRAYDVNINSGVGTYARGGKIRMVKEFDLKDGIQISSSKTEDGKIGYSAVVNSYPLQKYIPIVPNRSKEHVIKRAKKIQKEMLEYKKENSMAR